MRIIRLFLFAASLLSVPVMVTGETPPFPGDRVDGLRLTVPENPNEREYLGLDKQGDFSLVDISAQLMIVEIFSMYCPHCQREAPAVYRLFEAVEASTSLNGQVKLIGIGVGNSTYEVDHFRCFLMMTLPSISHWARCAHRISSLSTSARRTKVAFCGQESERWIRWNLS